MNCLIIGANGYIGSVLFERAKAVFTTSGTSSTGGTGHLPLRLDSPADFAYEKIQADDVVFLTAAISAPDICAREHERAWAVNVDGTGAFIKKAIARGARVVFFSSDTVYGEREEEFDETSVCNPMGYYAAMKHEVEQRFADNPAFKSIRLSYVFSRADKFTSHLIGCAQRSENAEIFHPFFRSIVHRDDVIEGALALAEHWHEFPERVINFGGPQVLSRVDFAQLIQAVDLHDLRFKITEPNADFFKNRPRFIAMKSPVFTRLLGRSPHTLMEAARIEFESITHEESKI